MDKVFETARLKIVPWKADVEDAEGLYNFAKNKNVGPAAGWKPHENIDESMKIIKEIFMPNDCFKIIDKSTNKIIGNIGFEKDIRRPEIKSLEIGYALDEEYWGQGIMTEAATRMLKYAFEDLKLDVVAIQTNTENKKSQRVIEKLGFCYEGEIRKSGIDYDGTVRDTFTFSMLKEEWENKY